MNFTAGPWKVMKGTSSPRICVEGEKDWPIVVTISGHSRRGIKNNEKLIASAPEMYHALEKIIAIINCKNEKSELISSIKKISKSALDATRKNTSKN